ncbi:polysaccharide pyruvyl transferase family protein [Drancourtella massiliensis]|uniref:Polysaccharide pyruvyl transferase family protein n=1 Tax=Drancourtella massiliensis TaxID=1632013 RepID=A0ABS2EKF9_9FIRM|nr:polysaccharide pyruvyl transferase family protein [Drancourtella massiliensis]MBM6745584.1 polysaccharide pyruvyl transferase family protein [Drancourtella massiliensis]
MNKIRKTIKKIIPRSLKIYLHKKKKREEYINCSAFQELKKTGKKIILFGTPEYGNLGDHAIAKAELLFLQQYCSHLPIVEVTQEMLFWIKEDVFCQIEKEDILIYTGGGFFGTLYSKDGMSSLRDIVRRFPLNTIIIFPQTIFYSQDGRGKRELNSDRQLFNKHEKLFLFLREKKSYRFAIKEKILNEDHIFCVPDIVLTLNLSKIDEERNNILVCLRDDKEKRESINIEIIKKFATECGMQVEFGTTRIERDLKNSFEREKALNDKLKEFSAHRLVVTDRLHGMIFSVITGTPCIAIDNLTRKVSGVYDWINDIEYVKMGDPNKLEDLLIYMKNRINKEYTYMPRKHYYVPLIEVMKAVTQ